MSDYAKIRLSTASDLFSCGLAELGNHKLDAFPAKHINVESMCEKIITFSQKYSLLIVCQSNPQNNTRQYFSVMDAKNFRWAGGSSTSETEGARLREISYQL